jgi:hypothetical protein
MVGWHSKSEMMMMKSDDGMRIAITVELFIGSVGGTTAPQALHTMVAASVPDVLPSIVAPAADRSPAPCCPFTETPNNIRYFAHFFLGMLWR